MGIIIDGQSVSSGGGGGTGSTNVYEHPQDDPLVDWPIEHLLGSTKLVIQVFEDIDDDGVLHPVDYDSYTPVDENNVIVHFVVAQAGLARVVGG